MTIAAEATVHASHAAAAAEWARSQAARAMVRAAMSSADVVYRRTWPSTEAIDLLGDAEYDPALRCDGWLDSTLDLRDGLSVVEVFTPMDQRAVLQALVALARR
jgi:hypothetical protein